MEKLSIINSYLTHNRCYQANRKREPIGIQIHTIGCAQGTAQAVADYWNSPEVSACVTYIVDCDTPGKVLKLLDEDTFSWADGGYGNRNLITIEICESDFIRYDGNGASYVVTDQQRFESDIRRGYATAVALCADICSRYDWDPLSKLSSGLHLISSHDEGRLAGLSTAHVDPSHLWPKLGYSMETFRADVARAFMDEDIYIDEPVKYYRIRKTWKNVASQLGAYEQFELAKAACPYLYRVYDDSGKCVYKNAKKPSGTQASAFAGLTESAVAHKLLELIHSIDKSGILNSITAAQAILESGYVTTQLAKTGNNLFGMKSNLSSNTWESSWGGKSVSILTTEVIDGETIQMYDSFRSYNNIEESIADHATYLLGSMNGKQKRYAGLTASLDYKEAIQIVKNGGYATDPKYVDKVCSIVQRFGLDIYDNKKYVYTVQVGEFKTKKSAEKKRTEIKDKTGFACTILLSDGRYYVHCGKFKKEVNATNRMKKLKNKYNLDGFLKKIPG